MKYWNELNELESAVYDVKTTHSLIKALECSKEQLPNTEFEEALYSVIELLELRVNKLETEFYSLWETVKNDTAERSSDNGADN